MDPLQLQHYQSLRKLGIGAGHALACSKQRTALHLKCAETGFAWAENRHGILQARWQQEGFDLTAAVVNDEDGWWTSGVEYIGRFSRCWQPGAIRHRHGDRNACEWFVPANLGDPKEEYRLACTYGHDWWYAGVEVKASRAGVTLGSGSLFGIEFGCQDQGDRQYLTEIAFDLASDAIAGSKEKLQTLCGCH